MCCVYMCVCVCVCVCVWLYKYLFFHGCKNIHLISLISAAVTEEDYHSKSDRLKS